MFSDADPAVDTAADVLRSKDPCEDPLFLLPAPWARIQESLYSGSPKVTNIELVGSGHAVTLGRQAPQLQHAMDAWADSQLVLTATPARFSATLRRWKAGRARP